MKPTSLARLALGCLAALPLTSCNSPLGIDSDARFTADYALVMAPAQDRFGRDEEATLRLENRSAENLGYGACSLVLERRVDFAWRRVSPAPEYCILILYAVRPGSHAAFGVDLSSFEPGVYRYRMDIMPGTSPPEVSIRSPAFMVVP